MRSNRSNVSVAPIIALLLVTAACELQRDPTGLDLERDVTGIHSLMVAGEDRARVLVVRFSRDIPVHDGGIEPVGDAVVRLTRDGEETTLGAGPTGECVSEHSSHLVQPGDGCYIGVLPHAVASGDRFELTVRMADGEVIRGSAVIPGAADVASPAPGDTVRVSQSRPDLWSGHLAAEVISPPDGALLELGIETFREPYCFAGLSVTTDEGFTRGRTVRIPPDEAGELVFAVDARCRNDDGELEPIGEIPSRFLAVAYDTAYARWIGELAVDGQDLPADRASAGLAGGAVGYFAGASRVEVPLQVVER